MKEGGGVLPGNRGKSGQTTVAPVRAWRGSPAEPPRPLTARRVKAWEGPGAMVFVEDVSDEEHAIAVAVEAVFLADGLVVGFEDEFAASEGADEHDEGAFGEVEIGEEGADDVEGAGWVEEDACFSLMAAGGDAEAW